MKSEVSSQPSSLAAIGQKPNAANRYGFGLYLALIWLGAVILMAVFAPIITPYDPIAQNPTALLQSPSWAHLLGTDDVGRDILSRLIYGARPTLIGVLIAVGIASLIGIPWGLVSGYVGGWVDQIMMRLADAVLVFPGLVLTLALTTAFGAGLESTMSSLGLVFSPLIARVIRVSVLSLRNKDFVIITKMYGASMSYRLFQHVLPNALPATMVQITLLTGLAILAQTGLNFLGLGVQSPHPSWGASVAETFRYVMLDPMAPLIPGLVVVATVLSIYRIGDELRAKFEVQD